MAFAPPARPGRFYWAGPTDDVVCEDAIGSLLQAAAEAAEDTVALVEEVAAQPLDGADAMAGSLPNPNPNPNARRGRCLGGFAPGEHVAV